VKLENSRQLHIEAVNDFVEEQDHKTLRDSIDNFNNLNDTGLVNGQYLNRF